MIWQAICWIRAAGRISNLPAIAETEHDVPTGPGRVHRRRVGDLLHPEREPQLVLDEAKREMGSMAFAAQYQQQPVAEEGNVVRWSWFRVYDDPPQRMAGDEILVSWDTALSEKELASYSAAIVVQVRGETVYVLDVVRDDSNIRICDDALLKSIESGVMHVTAMRS